MVLLMCSCCEINDRETESVSCSEVDFVHETIIPDSQSDVDISTNTEETQTIPSYEVNPYSSDYSYESVVNTCLEEVGIDDYSMGEDYEEESDYRLTYYPDYSIVLDELCAENDSGMVLYQPKEYEYHISREFEVDIWIYIVDFDNAQWAEAGFRNWAEEYLYSDYDFVVDCCSEGYFFARDDNWFTAYYYLGDFYVEYSYFFTNGNRDQYQIYLDICEELGLPTCDEVTEEIMGATN